MRLVGIVQDITARKQAESQRAAALEALRVSEERLRLLGDNLPDSAVYQYTREADGSPRLLYVSAGIERLTLSDLQEMQTHNVTPEFIREILALAIDRFETDKVS